MGKPKKLSDATKKWFINSAPKRKPEIKPVRKRFLIVCEGSKTEPNYFESVKRLLVKNTVEIKIEGVGKNTLSLLEHALDLFKKANRSIFRLMKFGLFSTVIVSRPMILTIQ